MVSSDVSIADISTGRAFDDGDALAWTTRLNPLSESNTYHWSSALEGKPSWSILDDESQILHIRAHDCPYPATPLNQTCYNCITNRQTADTEFVFMWKTTRAGSLEGRRSGAEPRSKPSTVDHTVASAGTPLNELFDTPWTDVFGTAEYSLGESSNLLLQHCGACSNPMDARLQQCATCVQNRAPDNFPNADYLMFVRMLRPDDGIERQQSFPGLHEARQGKAAPPRFGSPTSSSGGQQANTPNDTGNTKVFTN